MPAPKSERILFMKMLHLSDLHIGKRVHEFSMIEDQKYILNQIMMIAEQANVDGIFLSGDIYDRPIPSTEAIQVFDHFLTELANRNILVFAISGNHDSAERLAFGSSLMSSRGIYFSPVYQGTIQKISLTDEYGELVIHLLPFLKPAIVRHISSSAASRNEATQTEEAITTYQDAVRVALSQVELDQSKRNVLLAHQFVTGAKRCESEEVSVGGIDQIDVTLFDKFDYTALGHIHSPQHIGKETIRYCGTPLKYSFSEVEQEKSVTVVEFREKGAITLQTIPLSPLHDMRKLKGTYLELTTRSFYEKQNRNDYLQVTLTDEEDVPDALQKLRTIYPNLMQLLYDNQRTRENQQIDGCKSAQQKSEFEWIQEFFSIQNNRPMTLWQENLIKTLIEKTKREENL